MALFLYFRRDPNSHVIIKGGMEVFDSQVKNLPAVAIDDLKGLVLEFKGWHGHPIRIIDPFSTLSHAVEEDDKVVEENLRSREEIKELRNKEKELKEKELALKEKQLKQMEKNLGGNLVDVPTFGGVTKPGRS